MLAGVSEIGEAKRNAILNDKDGNNLINFGEFEVLFRTLGKKRINMAELVDQIENKFNEIILKRGITPVNRPAYGQKVLNDFLQTDNQLLLSNAPHGMVFHNKISEVSFLVFNLLVILLFTVDILLSSL